MREKYIFCLLFFVAACSVTPYQPTLTSSKALFDGEYDKAILDVTSAEQSYGATNRILWLYDLCILNHYNKTYEESNKHCQQADLLSEELSIDSISEHFLAQFAGDDVISYPGASHERTLVYPIGMINYALRNNRSEALVDARKLDIYADTVDNPHEEAFARLLAALIYESENEKDSAIIDYRHALNLYRSLPKYENSRLLKHIGGELLSLLDEAGMNDEFRRIKTTINIEKQSRDARDHGELVFIIETGLAPYKASEHVRIPRSGDSAAIGILKSRPPLVHHIRAKSSEGTETSTSEVIYDAQLAAYKAQEKQFIESFESETVEPILVYEMEKYGSDLFSADPISDHEQADVRNWASLPGKVSLLRMTLPEGKQEIALKFFSYYGEEVFRTVLPDVIINKKQRQFFHLKLP